MSSLRAMVPATTYSGPNIAGCGTRRTGDRNDGRPIIDRRIASARPNGRPSYAM